jgi:hypothetical protein
MINNRNYDGILWYKDKRGYYYNDKHGSQHVYIWQQTHQATVDSEDVIHHINGDKSDNRVENLQIMTRADHTRLHTIGKSHSLSDEHKLKISKARKGKPLSDEHKQKLSKSHLGKKLSDETRKKMSKSRIKYIKEKNNAQ